MFRHSFHSPLLQTIQFNSEFQTITRNRDFIGEKCYANESFYAYCVYLTFGTVAFDTYLSTAEIFAKLKHKSRCLKYQVLTTLKLSNTFEITFILLILVSDAFYWDIFLNNLDI